MVGSFGLLETVGAYLTGVTTVESRLLVSGAILTVALGVAFFVVPFAMRVAGANVEDHLERTRFQKWVVSVGRVVPWSFPSKLVHGLLVVGIVGVTAVALLVLWGLYDAALGALVLFEAAVPYVVNMVVTVGMFALAYVVSELIGEYLHRFSDRTGRLTAHQEEIVYRTIQLSLYIAAVIGVLGVWDVNLGGLLVGAGFLGIIIGMAARQTLGSAIAGFVLMFSRPFEIGDWIEVGEREGIVTDISIVNTRIESFDGEFVVLPNTVVSDSTIINRTRKGRIRLRLSVGIDYDTDIEHAEATIMDALRNIDEIMPVPTPQVVPMRFGDSAISLEVRFWIDKPSARRRWRANAAVVRAIKQSFDEEGISIPFPQRVMSSRDDGYDASGWREHDAIETESS